MLIIRYIIRDTIELNYNNIYIKNLNKIHDKNDNC